MIANILSIAGSDPSGGAGIQADLKTFSARGTYGMAAICALTAQNTAGVSAVQAISPDMVAEQIRMVFADLRVDAVKIGMIANAGIAAAIARELRPHPHVPVVLDTVMVAKGGANLLDRDAITTLIEQLLPRASLATPNLPEAAALLGVEMATDRQAMENQARALLRFGPKAVLLKGGHLTGEQSPDLLVTVDDLVWVEGARIATRNTHGTGCSLSSAIAAELGKGAGLVDAVHTARHWLAGAIAASGNLSVGHGHGPVHHFHALWA